tara:strand:+ start:76 stop:2139 length:2064 start_codon:yes stop_codon:yes gene_type:complete
MSTTYFNIALTTGAYPDLVGTSSNRAQVQAGDTIEVNITIANSVKSQYNISGGVDSLGVSLISNPYAGTFSNQGTPGGIYSFSFTADSSWVGNTLNPMSFFTRNNGAVIGTQAAGTLVSGRIWWAVYAVPNQSHGSVTGVSATGTASETPAITVSSTGTTGNGQVGYSKTSSSTSSTYPITWINHASSLTGPTRGGWDFSGNGVKDSTWYFWKRSSNYWATNQSLAAGVAYTPPYLAADLSISITNATLTSSDGTWTVNFTGGGSNENYAIANGSSSTANPYYSSGTTKVDSGVGGSSIYNSNASNTPSGTTTYYIWGSRTKVSGGSGGQGWNTTGWGYTGQSFTVEMGVDETCDNPSGKWFDTTSSAVDPSNSDNALRTRASFSGLSVNKAYVVARQDSGGSYEEARAWWSGSTGLTVTFTDPLAALDTQRTYKLYSNSSQSLSGATEELSFTRTRITPEVTESPVSVLPGVTSYTTTLGNTDVGITYYIMDGSGTGATTLASGTATGTSLDLTVSSNLPTNTLNSTTTVYIWALSPLNWYSTTAFPTGESIVVTRVAAGGTGGGGTTPASPGDYGMIVKNDAGNIVVDTTSRFGRIVGSGTLTASNGGYIAKDATSPQVQVSGMDTSDNTAMTWHVVVTNVDMQGSGVEADRHTVNIGTGFFTITNTTFHNGNGHKYKYVIVRSR